MIRTRLEEQDRQDLVPVASSIKTYVETQNPDGSWPSLDYANTSITTWVAADHVKYMAQMAAAYRTQGHAYYQSDAVAKAVCKALDYWVAAKLVNANWWYNDIGVPMYLGPALLLMQPQLSAAQIAAGSALLPNAPQLTGENRVWYSFGAIHRAFLEAKLDSLPADIEGIKSVLVVLNTADDGIQVDQTFYQHSTQIYNGGYGLQFLSDVSKWSGILAGTALNVDGDAKAVLDDLVLDGTGWMIRHGQIDYSTMGRNLARNGTGNETLLLQSVLQRLIAGGSARSSELQALLSHVSGSGDGIVGQKHFWRADYSVQRSADAMVSLRLFSKRTVGAECGNGENVLGVYQPFGTTFIYRTGSEYTLIFPSWDWNRLPGTTLEQVAALPTFTGYLRGTQAFAGGVSDGQVGMSAFLQDDSRNTAKAHKSWFLFGDGFLALGAGIQASGSGSVFTTLNQCLLKGTVLAHRNGTTASVARGETDLDAVDWVLHDMVGYVFPAPTPVHLKNEAQAGNWHSINHGYGSLAVSNDVFLLGQGHGVNPANATYAYFVLPGTEELVTADFAANNPVTILSNTADVQAARHKTGFSGIAFFAPGSVTLKTGLSVASDSPILLLVREISTGLEVSVADPTQTLAAVQITVTGRYTGTNTTWDANAKSTRISVTLPVSEHAGSSVKMVLPRG